jgi:hypothetical protein
MAYGGVKMSDHRVLTVAELRSELAMWPDNAIVHFEGFAFNRLKSRGQRILQVEIYPINAEEQAAANKAALAE